MKRVTSVALLLILCAAFVFATPYEEILQKAMTNSPDMQNNEIVYQNSLLTQQQNDLDDVPQVTISTGTISVLPVENSRNQLPRIPGFTDDPKVMDLLNASAAVQAYLKQETVNADFTMSPSVEIVLPNDGETTITAETGLGFEYGNNDYYSVSPSLSASHTFDLTGYDADLSADLSSARASLQSEQTYQKAKLNFETLVLSSIKAILQAEQSLAETQYSLTKAEYKLQNALTLGSIDESSMTYLQMSNQIDLYKNTIDATEKQIATAQEQYTTLTGLVWDGVEELPDPDLTLKMLDSGNTDVILASIDVEIARQSVEEKKAKANPSSIMVSGGVNSSLSENSKSIGGSAGISYTSGNWSVGTAFKGTYNNNTKEFTPALTFAGTWSNKTTKRSDELELQKLNNELISAQNSLTAARTSYVQSVQNLQIDILNYNYTLSNQAATKQYLQSNLDYLETMYDAGLCTVEELMDARMEVQWSDTDDVINTIDGLLLQIEIEELNL